jgi:uncharacterized tellurite resistance protein B-like protein
MARIARVDKQIVPQEYQAIVSALKERWHINDDEAEFVASAATADSTAKLDPFRTAREFFDVCTHDELADFAKVLFRIAAADGKATFDEIQEVRTICNTLLLSHEDYIAAKRSIPRELRED